VVGEDLVRVNKHFNHFFCSKSLSQVCFFLHEKVWHGQFWQNLTMERIEPKTCILVCAFIHESGILGFALFLCIIGHEMRFVDMI